MTGKDLAVVIIGLVFIFIISHLSVDKDFPSSTRVGAYITMGIVTTLYVIFGIII